MPEDPIGDKAGNTTRCFQLLEYFQKQNDRLEVEFISFYPWKENAVSKFQEIFPDISLTLINRQGPKSKNYLLYFLIDKLPKLLSRLFTGDHIISRCTPYINQQFKKAVKGKTYDISLISYAYWGDLQKYVDSTYSINDTHDFITKQFMVVNKNVPSIIGRLFQEELKILNRFNEIWSYSVEEHFIFEQFLDKKVQLLPISFPIHQLPQDRDIQYDILYVASDNPHNEKSIKWFLDLVLPLLKDVKIYIVGKICRFVPDHPAIVKLGIVDNLEEYYSKSKITICPMISGTGIKIKVLESLSFGLPVVTNRRGVDGLLNKSNNGCLVSDSPIEFASYIKRLLEDEVFYHKISQEGQEFFRDNYSKDHEVQILNETFLT